MGDRQQRSEDREPRPRRRQRAALAWLVVLLGGAAGLFVVCGGIAVVVLWRGMAARTPPPPRTPDEAWQRLEGSWSRTLTAGNSTSVLRFRFTRDRKLIFSSSLTGGVLPGSMKNEVTLNVNGVTLRGNDILLTLGPGPGGQSGNVMTVRFVGADQIVVDDSEPFTRER